MARNGCSSCWPDTIAMKAAFRGASRSTRIRRTSTNRKPGSTTRRLRISTRGRSHRKTSRCSTRGCGRRPSCSAGKPARCSFRKTASTRATIRRNRSPNRPRAWPSHGRKSRTWRRSTRGNTTTGRTTGPKADLRIGLRKYPDEPGDPSGKKPIWHLYRALGTAGEEEALSRHRH